MRVFFFNAMTSRYLHKVTYSTYNVNVTYKLKILTNLHYKHYLQFALSCKILKYLTLRNIGSQLQKVAFSHINLGLRFMFLNFHFICQKPLEGIEIKLFFF